MGQSRGPGYVQVCVGQKGTQVAREHGNCRMVKPSSVRRFAEQRHGINPTRILRSSACTQQTFTLLVSRYGGM